MSKNYKRILILEDDYQLSKTLRSLLQTELQAEVQWTDSVDKAIQLLDLNQYDLAIVDWVLTKQETGLEFIEYVHEFFSQLKILMLTKCNTVEQRLKAYHLGTDTYLAKPFSCEELLVKINQLFNQFKLSDNRLVKYQNITLYLDSGKLLIDNQAITIRRKEAAILKILMANNSSVVTKQQLIDQVWLDPNKQPNINTIEVYMRRLRQKLGPYASYLKNKRGYGYFFAKGNEQ